MVSFSELSDRQLPGIPAERTLFFSRAGIKGTNKRAKNRGSGCASFRPTAHLHHNEVLPCFAPISRGVIGRNSKSLEWSFSGERFCQHGSEGGARFCHRRSKPRRLIYGPQPSVLFCNPGFLLEGREPPLTLRHEKQYLYFGHLFPCTPGPNKALFLKNSHRAGRVLQELPCTTGWHLTLYLRHFISATDRHPS